MTDVNQLPARPPLTGEFGPVPAITEIAVGDLVAIYSRGRERVAMVEKIGRTNLGCVYTTKGAWDEATRLHQSLTNPGRIQWIASFTEKQEQKNFDFYLQEVDPATAKYGSGESYQGYVDEGRDAYVARMVESARVGATEAYEKAITGGVEQYVAVTRKSVKLQDVIGWKRP